MELLAPYLDGARIVDLFAGTGALGLEALSRGAHSADFVENNPAAIHSLKANVAAFRVRDRTRVFDRDAIPFAERLAPGSYDIAMADPPYGSRKLDRIVRSWLDQPFSGVLALEHAALQEMPPGALTRRLDASAVTLLRLPRNALDGPPPRPSVPPP
jgi:16S rRNA (guanine966-N2)-methyltransferase